MYKKSIISTIKISFIYFAVLYSVCMIASIFFRSNGVVHNLIYLAADILAVIVTVLFTKKHFGISVRNYISLEDVNCKKIFACILVGASSTILIQELTAMIWTDILHTTKLPSSETTTGSIAALLILCFNNVIIGPIAEELTFRGCCFECVKKQSNTAFAVILTSVIFGVLHFGGGWHMLSCALAGAVFAFAYIFTKNIVYSIVTHMSCNAAPCIFAFMEYNHISVTAPKSGYIFFTAPVFIIGIFLFAISVGYIVINYYRQKRKNIGIG